MKRYEIIVVFQPKLTESQLKDEQKRVTTLIESNGGKIVTSESWGKKEIAYLVDKEAYGFYMKYEVESENSALIATLNANLRILDAVLKFQTLKLSTKTRKVKINPKRAARIAAGEEEFEYSSDSEY